MSREVLSLSNPLHIRAEMARAGIGPGQLDNYVLDREDIGEIRSFLFRIYAACIEAEKK
jgi:hypothetical protein